MTQRIKNQSLHSLKINLIEDTKTVGSFSIPTNTIVAIFDDQQVRAFDALLASENTTIKQMVENDIAQLQSVVPSIVVRNTSGRKAASYSKRAATEGERRRNRNKRSRKRGGWKTRCGLYWSEVKQAAEFNKLAMEAGLPLNWFVSIHPPASVLAMGDAITKRWLSNKAKHIQQTVRGRSVIRQAQVPCITVYHKDRGGALHCHMLIHVARGNFALERIADGSIIDVKRAVKEHINYITKHRLPLSPEFEATTTHRRKSSDPIRGVLLSFNKDAKRIWKIVGLISETKKSPS